MSLLGRAACDQLHRLIPRVLHTDHSDRARVEVGAEFACCSVERLRTARVDRLEQEVDVGGLLGDASALALAPVPGSTVGPEVVALDDLARPWWLVAVEVLVPGRRREDDIAVDAVEILAAKW